MTFFLGLPAFSQAQTAKDWLGGTDAFWATGSNWSGSVAPTNDLLTNIANFNQATYLNQPDAGTVSIAGLSVGSSSGAVTITSAISGGLTIGGSGIDMSAATANLTLGTGSTQLFTLGTNQTWTVASGRTLTVAGILAGNNNLTVTGGGIVSLTSGNNSFGGVGKTVTVEGGSTLRATNGPNNVPSFGSTSNTLILNGGTLAANPQNDPAAAFTRAITLNSGGANFFSVNSTSNRGVSISGLVSGTGGVAFSGNSIVALTNTTNSLGGIVGVNSGTLLVVGNSTVDALGTAALSLGGGNTIFTGSTANAGPINFSRAITVVANSSLGAGAGYTLTQTGTLSGSSTLSINSGPTGTFTTGTLAANNINPGATSIVVLNGNASTFTGGITISNGQLKLGTAPLPTLFGTITVTAAGNALDLNGRSIATTLLSSATTTATIINSSVTASTITLVGSSGSFNGVIGNTGTINLIKTGTGSSNYGANNTFTGSTTIAGGTITITGSFSGTNDVTIRNGGTLTLSNSAGDALRNAAPITLGGTGFGGGTLSTTLTTTPTETVGILNIAPGASTITTAANQTLIFAALGTRSTGGSLNFTTGGTNSFTGLGNGILGPWGFFGGGDYALIFGNAVSSLSAATTVSDTETVTGNATPWSAASNVNIGAVFSLGADRITNTLRNTSAGGTLQLSTFNLSLGGILQNGSTAALQFSRTGTSNGIIASSGELVVGGNTAFGVTFNVPITGTGGAATALTVSVSNAVTLANSGNKFSDIYLNSGTLTGSAANALGNATPGTIYLSGSSVLNLTAIQSYSTANNNAKMITVAGGPKIIANTPNSTDVVTFDNANITLGDNSTLTLGFYGNGSSNGTLAFHATGGKITGNGSLLFGGSSGGFGTIFSIYGANDYTGNTSFGNGNSGSGGYRINFNTPSAFGTGTIILPTGNGGLALESLQALSANLTLTNSIRSLVGTVNTFFNLGGSTTNNFTLSGPISLESAFLLGFTVAANRTITLSGNISEVGGVRPITVVGPGSLLLSGVSTYTGATTLRSGTLLVGGNAPSGLPGALGNATSAVAVGDAGTLAADNLALLTSAAIGIDRNVAVGNLNTTGTTTLGGSAPVTSAFNGAIGLGKNAILTQPNGGTINFNGAISGTGFGIAKTGTGTVVLGAPNSYTGNTTVNTGTLRLNVTGALPNGSATALAGGTLAVANNTTNGSTGGGILTVSAASTIDFGGAASPTALSFGNTSGATLTAPLVITGYTGQGMNSTGAPTTRLFFGGSNILTVPELMLITFNGYDMGGSSAQLGNGEVVPLGVVPEPGTILGLAALGLGLGNWVRRWRK